MGAPLIVYSVIKQETDSWEISSHVKSWHQPLTQKEQHTQSPEAGNNFVICCCCCFKSGREGGIEGESERTLSRSAPRASPM